MSLWAEYISERMGHEVLENEKGFISFEIRGDKASIEDLFVRPEFRRQGVALALTKEFEEIAKQRGAKVLYSCTSTKYNKPEVATESVRLSIAYGFRVFRSDDESIWFMKELV